MSDIALGTGNSPDTAPSDSAKSWTLKDFLWACPQPILVLGFMILVANMVASDWIYRELFGAIMIVLPIPLCIFAERIWTKRKDWLLEP